MAENNSSAPLKTAEGAYPALPAPDTHCHDEDTGRDVWSYSAEQMRAYAAQAVAAQAVPLDDRAQRLIGEAVRCSYDTGYNDARRALSVRDDGYPGYDGRAFSDTQIRFLIQQLGQPLPPVGPYSQPALSNRGGLIFYRV